MTGADFGVARSPRPSYSARMSTDPVVPRAPRPEITAVISTHNRCDTLRETLARLSALNCPGLSIIVVDNASDDGTRAFLRAKRPYVQTIPHSLNNALRGYNIAFDEARTPYVLVLDDDSSPLPGTLESMAAFLDGSPGVAAAAANVVDPAGISEWGARGEAEAREDWYNLIGCGFMIRREVLAEAEGYDESFGLYYNDLDLALQILALGYRIAYRRAWKVEHRRPHQPHATAFKHAMMARNFPRLVRNHVGGWRKWDLIAGHAALSLAHAAKDGCAGRCLTSLIRGIFARGGRLRLPLPPSPAASGFARDYSLAGHLLRPNSAGNRDETAAVASPRPAGESPRRLVRRCTTPPILPPCHWRQRFLAEDAQAVAASVAGWRRRLRDRALGCDCRDLIPWYVSPWPDYQRYLVQESFLSCAERSYRREQAAGWHYTPLISILTPVYKVDAAWLDQCLQSVERQIYPHWELCLVDDGSGRPDIRKRLLAFRKRHPDRVKLAVRDENRGIARTSQETLDMATGEFVALLDHDDRLAPEALFEVVQELNLRPDTDWVYADNDRIAPDGRRWYYHFKPDWSPDLLLSYNYVLHLSVMRRELVRKVGGFRPEYEGSHDYDLYLRLAENTGRIRHVSKILYSWREATGSIAGDISAKPYVFEAGIRALDDAIRRRGERGSAEPEKRAWAGNYRVRRQGPAPAVDLVVLGVGAQAEQTAGEWKSGAESVEIAAVWSAQARETEAALLSRALTQTRSPVLAIVSAGSRADRPDTLAELAKAASLRGVGAAAPKIVNSVSGSVDHCGMGLSVNGTPLYPLRGLAGNEPGYGAYGAIVRNVSAVSPVCGIFNTDALRAAGGFDSSLTGVGAVVSACLALQAAGFRVVADGGANVRFGPALFDAGEALRPGGSDLRQIVRRWPVRVAGGDPYYNRHLRETPADFGVGW